MSKIVTSVNIGGPWQSGTEEVNNNSRRTLNTKGSSNESRKSSQKSQKRSKKYQHQLINL